jgi:23S rRNA pseudouridine1911/1915/1917 synthase
MILKNVPLNLANQRLDKVASILFQTYSRTQIKKWILEGRVLVNGEISNPKDLIHENDEIEINPIEENKISWASQKVDFEVHFESNNFIIINKSPGLVMHPGSGCNDGTLANGLLYRYPELANLPRSGIVHRLDKDTSGVLLVAKNEKFRNYFIKLMQERKIIKEYIAVVAGPTLGSFSIDYPIGRDRFNRTKMALRADGKDAITDVKLNQSFNNYSLLDVSIKTGRTHQIRVHLSSRKLPIIGDKTYDPAKTVTKGTSSELIEIIRSFPRQALHASLLSFECPDTKKKLSYEIPIPLDIKNLISSLKKHS